MGVVGVGVECIVVVGFDAERGLVRARSRPWRKGESLGGRAVGEERLWRCCCCCCCCGGVVFVAVVLLCFEGEVVEEEVVEATEARLGVAKPVEVVVVGGVASACGVFALMTVGRQSELFLGMSCFVVCC